ncbi:hypothetical protein KIPB_004159 [Kipferlia bialata]|uniref:Leucine-rich repeat-containing N-terminal plant-type domain-containing protein n=1 Tax=Kipferlia bialata TaxID=797122 RepID=A0A9K3CVK9_9EUKA|nr:hypothetical protein KIPB_004159 [Kipferlia bialata]|eukprot:g4159.t1
MTVMELLEGNTGAFRNHRMKLLFVAVALLAVALGQTCTTERDALEAIYDATNGLDWTVANNWLSNDPHCEWTGVSCNSSGWVVLIDLSSFGLTGSIPDEIGCFPFIKTLYLNDADMNTAIPDSICLLQALKYFQIQDAGLVGDIPECMCTMEYMQYFYATNNQLQGTIPACVNQMTYLREIHVYVDGRFRKRCEDVFIRGSNVYYIASNQAT